MNGNYHWQPTEVCHWIVFSITTTKRTALVELPVKLKCQFDLTDAPLRLLRQTWPVWRSPEAARLPVRRPPTVGTEIRSPAWLPHRRRLFSDASQTLFTLSRRTSTSGTLLPFFWKTALRSLFRVKVDLLIIRGNGNNFRAGGRNQGNDWTTRRDLSQLQIWIWDWRAGLNHSCNCGKIGYGHILYLYVQGHFRLKWSISMFLAKTESRVKSILFTRFLKDLNYYFIQLFFSPNNNK